MVAETLILHLEISTHLDLNKLKFEHFYFQRVSTLEAAIECQYPVRLHSEIPANDYWQKVTLPASKIRKEIQFIKTTSVFVVINVEAFKKYI